MLEAIGFKGDLRVSALPPGEEPYLVAHIRTPTGLRELSFVVNADTRQFAPR